MKGLEAASRAWQQEQRRHGRWALTNMRDSRTCLDCGAYVHVDLLWLHDDFHNAR